MAVIANVRIFLSFFRLFSSSFANLVTFLMSISSTILVGTGLLTKSYPHWHILQFWLMRIGAVRTLFEGYMGEG